MGGLRNLKDCELGASMKTRIYQAMCICPETCPLHPANTGIEKIAMKVHRTYGMNRRQYAMFVEDLRAYIKERFGPLMRHAEYGSLVNHNDAYLDAALARAKEE